MGLRGVGARSIAKREVATIRTGITWEEPGLKRWERVVRFIETLPITSGDLAGTPFKLRSWQVKHLKHIYREKDGRRVVRQALLTMPRKNGKTGLTAALALCHFCGPESEERGQVYSAAAERNQASLIYEEMKAIIERVGWMRDRIIVRDFTKKLEDTKTGTVFLALSADANTKHGFNTSCWIYDELAQAPDRKLYDVLDTSTAARKEPLGIVISTQSADPNSIMSELVDYGQQILDGVIEDESFYPCIYTAPLDADPWDEKTWFECNPALGDFRDLEEMRTSALKAQRIPAREATFRLLYLNQRVQAEHRFVPKSDWDACGIVADQRDSYLEALRRKTCFGAVDLSSSGKNDLTSLVLVFPLEEKVRAIVPFFWASEQGLEEAEKRDRAPYRLWAGQGHLLTIPKRIIDYGFIAEKLAELQAKYDLQSVAFDPWKINNLIQACDDIHLNLKLVPHAQSYKEMDQSIQVLEDDILAWQLKHDGNPLMSLCIDNVKIELDSSGNRKFSKRKSNGRIDGAVALAMGVGLTASQPTTPEYSIHFVG